MTNCSKQNRAALLESRELPKPLIPEQGGSRGKYTANSPAENSQRHSTQDQDEASGAAAGEVSAPDSHPQDSATVVARSGGEFHTADFSPLRHLGIRRHLDRGTTDHRQSVAHRACFGARPPVQLPPRILETPLVQLDLGTNLDRFCSGALGSRGACNLGGRRHRRRASRQESLRQGLPSRRRAFEPFVHGLPLWAQMGGIGYLGEVSLCHSSLGFASAGSFVSLQGMGPATWTTAQNAFGIDAATVVGAAALVPRTALRVRRRWWLWHARTVALCGAAPR